MDREPKPAIDAATRVCRRLRNKGMFLDVEPDPSVPSMSDGFVWCALSLNCLGPDSRLVSLETCRHGRSCYRS